LNVKVTYKAAFVFVVILVVAAIMAVPAAAGEANGTLEQFPSSSCDNGGGEVLLPNTPR
jgi:hypothetical protein